MEGKSFQELNLSHGFLFSAALEDAKTCRLILECVLDIPVSEVTVRTEYNVLYSTDFKCIRLDVFAKDEAHTSYNLEMQNENKGNLPKRSRYYQAKLDVSSMKPGQDYGELQPLYVMFICNFDPFGEGYYRYTFEMQCVEKCFPLQDGVKRIFYNTKGKNAEAVPAALVEFLGYLNDSTDTYAEAATEVKVKKIHEHVKELKKNRDLGEKYMTFEEVMRDREEKGRAQGLEEGRIQGLEEGRTQGLEEGRTQGLEEGRTQGLEEGKGQGMKLMKELIQYMNDAGHSSQIQRVLSDEAFLQEKLEELQQYKGKHSQ